MAFMSGKQATVKVFLDGSPVTFLVQSWTVNKKGVDCEDGLCGENRPRLQNIPQGYDIQITCFQKDTAEIRKLMLDEENDDANVSPLNKAVAISLKPTDGTHEGFVTSGEVVFGNWSMAMGGQTERSKLTLPVRCQYLKPVQTL